jgi:hypothetical protein
MIGSTPQYTNAETNSHLSASVFLHSETHRPQLQNIFHFYYKVITMPRAQALSEILLQNFKSLSPHLHSLPSPKHFCNKTNILRVPGAAERSGNQQNLFHYSTNILTSSITTLLTTSHTPLFLFSGT